MCWGEKLSRWHGNTQRIKINGQRRGDGGICRLLLGTRRRHYGCEKLNQIIIIIIMIKMNKKETHSRWMNRNVVDAEREKMAIAANGEKWAHCVSRWPFANIKTILSTDECVRTGTRERTYTATHRVITWLLLEWMLPLLFVSTTHHTFTYMKIYLPIPYNSYNSYNSCADVKYSVLLYVAFHCHLFNEYVLFDPFSCSVDQHWNTTSSTINVSPPRSMNTHTQTQTPKRMPTVFGRWCWLVDDDFVSQ